MIFHSLLIIININYKQTNKDCVNYKQTIEKIVNKGRGAYYSSGSRPNQSADSWGLARLGSALTGGYASVIDFHLLHEGCNHNGKAYQMAKRTCEKMGRCGKYIE
jgi:hypothetical protein